MDFYAYWSLAGRIVALRPHGKAAFGHILGDGARLQFYVKLDVVGAEQFKLFQLLDLGDIIGVMRDSGIGVLLVEHHTDFVFRVCDRVTALNLGRVIAHGSATAVRNDPEVIRVYLGA